MQGLWWKSNLRAQQAKISMQGLWREPDLWAQQDKITMQRLQFPWTPSWGRAKPCLYCLENDKETSSTEHLRCNIETFKKYIEQQFTEGMSWENYGEWHIDHKIPLKYNKLSFEEVAQRCATQTHSLCGQLKIFQKAVDIFLTDLDHFSFLADLEKTWEAWETVFQRPLKVFFLLLRRG